MAAIPSIRRLLLLQLALVAWLCSPAQGIWLSLPPSGTKCVSEEIHANVVVLADYVVVPEETSHEQPSVSSKVTSPYGNTLHHLENVTSGQFAFTTTEYGNYLACFWLEGPKRTTGASLNLEWRTGIAAKDWDSVAKKEKIEGVELELLKLDGAVDAIKDNLMYLKDKEKEMREVSERTNSRVAWFSIMSLGVCIAASVVQVLHLKSFFRKKKLI